MININFFEKKKTNLLPYIASGIFLLLFLSIGLYFFFMRMYYTKTAEEKNAWLEEHLEEVALAKQLSEYEDFIYQAEATQKILVEKRYPMNAIVEGVASAIPDEPDQIASFQLMEPNQIVLILENIQPEMSHQVVENLELLPYVSRVQFLRAAKQDVADEELEYELNISLDEEELDEEQTK